MILSPITYTYGLPGSGKTYLRCAKFFYDYLLPETNSNIITNFPVDVETISLKLSEKTGKDPDEYLRRITIIPKDVLEAWIQEKTNPIEYFNTFGSLEGTHISLDEIHNFCGTHQSKKWKGIWRSFLGEVRHRKATFEGVTQANSKVDKAIHEHAQIRFIITNTETIRDPFFNIQYYQWHQLQAKFVGDYQPTFTVKEQRFNGEKWEDQEVQRLKFEKFYYQFYNSFSNPYSGGQGGTGLVHPYQKHSWLGLIWWFWKQVKWKILGRIFIVILIGWLCFGGGVSRCVDYFTKIIYGAMGNQIERKDTNAANMPKPANQAGIIRNVQQAAGNHPDPSRPTPATGPASVPASGPAGLPEQPKPRKTYSLSKGSLLIGSREFRAGDRIKHRDKERQIVNIDFDNRTVTLDDKTIIHVGSDLDDD